jgi:hypothetical protein
MMTAGLDNRAHSTKPNSDGMICSNENSGSNCGLLCVMKHGQLRFPRPLYLWNQLGMGSIGKHWRSSHAEVLLLLLSLQARDPIPQLKRIMLEQGLASEDDIKAIHDR